MPSRASTSVPGTLAIVRRASALLARRYGTPRLNNRRHPVSELVFIILSARTKGIEHEATYRRLRRRFPTWDAARDARVSAIEAVIRDAGLSKVKARQIKRLLLQLTANFGNLSGEALRKMDSQSLERYLTSLAGVGVKTARCVMMYSLDRQVFPVDTHCMRLFENLGFIDRRMRFEDAQALQDFVPPRLRYSLHVNAVAHGRQTCLPVAPRCHECAIRPLCCNAKEAAGRSDSRRT